MVPAGILVDNQTNFATLQAALTTPGLVAGDSIQIEPGSAPGNIGNASLPQLMNLTIKGDAAAGLLATPQFDITGAVTIGANQAGFTLQGVNVGLITAGSLTFNANASILGSSLVDAGSSAAAAVTLASTGSIRPGTTTADGTAGTLTLSSLDVNGGDYHR